VRSGPRSLIASVLAAAIVLGPGALVAAGAVATPAKMIQMLNAERRAHHIPAGIKLDPTWSGKCRRHDRYMARNRILTHDEQRGVPGYTAGGAWAGRHSVLEYGTTWLHGNPYDQAPIHFVQLMQPALSRSGGYELASGGTTWGCTVTLAGWRRPIPSTTRWYTFPGPGKNGVRTTYHAAELPVTPNRLVGAPNRCGQELFVFVTGPAVKRNVSMAPLSDITRAVLRPRGGRPVAIKVVDGLTWMPAKFAGVRTRMGWYFGPGTGIVIPVRPLRPTTTYVASVRMRVNGVTLRHTWSFRTRT